MHVGDGNLRICTPIGEEYGGKMALLCNVPWAVAVSTAHRSMPLSSFTEQGFHDPATRRALGLVRTVHDPAQNRHGTIEPGHVTIRFRNGDAWEATADRALGHAERPMTGDLVADKVRVCASSAASPPDSEAVERLIERCLALESIDDASEIVRLTFGAAAP